MLSQKGYRWESLKSRDFNAFTPQEQAMKAQRGSRGISLLFLQPRRQMGGVGA
jgi:hypothetical protein